MFAKQKATDTRLASSLMPDPDLCTEEEVKALVHAFYSKVRKDPVLAPIFESHIADWDHHLARIVDFWSSALRGTARYKGAPMPKHVALPGLSPALFHRWLALFRETTQTLENAALQQRPGSGERAGEASLIRRRASQTPAVASTVNTAGSGTRAERREGSAETARAWCHMRLARPCLARRRKPNGLAVRPHVARGPV